MSDLYLVLRSRLDGVPEWVYIPTDVLKAARERKGLSYETMGRTVPVSAKTWERYEKAGRVPRAIVIAVADTLELEIEEPTRPKISVEPDLTQAEQIEELRRLLVAIDRRFDTDLLTKLDRMDSQLRELASRSSSVSR